MQGPAGFSDPFFESLMLDTSAGYGLRRRQDAQKMLKKGKKGKSKREEKRKIKKVFVFSTPTFGGVCCQAWRNPQTRGVELHSGLKKK
jgi:hypothetical protein